MTESPAEYLVLNDISPELLQALREVLKCGYGKINVIIEDHKIKLIEKSVSVKVEAKV